MLKNIYLYTILLLLFAITKSNAATKTSTGTGNWNTSGTWTPSGVPGSSDVVIITGSHVITVNANASCKSITVGANAQLTFNTNKKLTISGAAGLTANGIVNMNGGDITLSTSGATFAIGSAGTFTWNPSTNTTAGATLFTNGTENFAATSTLIINKWYNYSIGLGSVVSSNFGNLNIATGGSWDMDNTLQTRAVIGTLTITSTWVILDQSGSISNTTIGDIVIANSSSYLDLFDGTHPSSFIVNTTSVTVNGGEFDCFYNTGTGSCTLNVSGNVSASSGGKFMGAYSSDANTTINVSGNIDLTRSYFYGSRTGNGNSVLNVTGNISILKSGSTYSEFYSVVDGNGNATVSVSGNLINQGYVDLIWNTGVTGVGNGNSSLTVSGTYTQTEGDFRGVWNLTTTTAGTCSITMNNVNYSGGVFMVYYAVTSTTKTNTFIVNGNLSINFTNSTDIFRGNGLAVLSSVNNLATINTTVTGTTTISGNSSAEFTNSVSYGNETVSTTGNIILSGGINKFQNGNHTFIWNHAGNISITGGTNYFSAASGTATINITGNLAISGGTLATKSSSGTSTVSIGGSFTQTSGTFYLYNNSTTSSAENISINIAGDFSQTAGTINYSDNSNSTGIYSINLSGSNYTIGGTGGMTAASAGSGTLYGQLNFAKAGTITFTRSSSTHSIQQVKQTINNGTILLLSSGNLQIASSATAGTSFLTIANGGVLNTGTNQILSNATATNSGLNVASGGKIKTANTYGLYDGTSNATINYTGNMDFDLNANSTIEYTGVDNQVVTGFGVGIATQTKHKYGNLIINFTGTSDVEYSYLTANTNVRTQLILTSGELKLNNNNLIIESGSTSAITRSSGYIKSETNSAVNNSIVKWMSMTSGAHIFPFATNSSNYIPVTFSPSIGTGGYVEVSTRATGTDNTPLTGLSSVSAVTNLNRQGADVAVDNVIDRWWVVNAPGFTADVTLSYLGSENTTLPANTYGTFAIQSWDGTRWSTPFATTTGVSTGVGTITAYGISSFTPFVLVSANGALPIKLLSFDAKLNKDHVNINWSTASEKDNDFFTVEKSIDGKTFDETDHVKGAGTCYTTKNYSSIDNNPAQGKSYYRLKQTDFNGHFTYSPIRVISNETYSRVSESSLEILSLGPNPFKNQFTLNYKKSEEGESRITIMNMQGQIVYDETRIDSQGSNSFDYQDDRNLAPGNYILNVISDNEKITKKLIKTSN